MKDNNAEFAEFGDIINRIVRIIACKKLDPVLRPFRFPLSFVLS